MPNTANETPEFSYPVKVAHISVNPVQVRISANEVECRALATLWNVLTVASVDADLQINRWKKDGIHMRGTVHAVLTQACIVTLEPVDAEISETIDVIFVPEGSKLARLPVAENGELVLDPDGPDLPEIFSGDTIDAGLMVTEHVALAIEPYPRKSGIAFGDHIESTGKDDIRPNPFAVLQGLKKD